MTEEEKVAFYATPQQWNRYSYVTNNPLRYSDPDGLERYDRSVSKEEQERIHNGLIDIAATGNEHQQEVATFILASDVTIRIGQGAPDGAVTTVDVNGANDAIARGGVSMSDAGSFISITVNKSNADDQSRKGRALLEGILVHEGEHVLSDVKTISSLSGKGRVFDETVYKKEHDAFVSEATFLRDRGGKFTKVGLSPRSHSLLTSDDRGIKVNEAQIRQVLLHSYQVTPRSQGKTTTQKFGLRRPR